MFQYALDWTCARPTSTCELSASGWSARSGTSLPKLEVPRERLAAMLEYAAVLARLESADATAVYRDALNFARDAGQAAEYAARLRLIEHFADLGDLQSAREELVHVSEGVREARVFAETGRPNLGRRRAFAMPPDAGTFVVGAQLALAADEPEAALRLAQRVALPPDGHDLALEAEVAAVSAAAHAATGWHQWPAALEAVGSRDETWLAHAGPAGRRVLATRAAIELRVLGNRRAAQDTLALGAGFASVGHDDEAVELALLNAEVADRDGARLLTDLSRRLAREGAPVRQRVRVAVEGIVRGDVRQHAPALIAALARIRPAGAAVELLSGLARAAPTRHRRLRDAILRVIRDASTESLDGDDEQRQRLRLAELERVAGSTALLRTVIGSHIPGEDPRQECAWISLLARAIGDGHRFDPAARHACEELETLARTVPSLAAACALELAWARAHAVGFEDPVVARALSIVRGTPPPESPPSLALARLRELEARVRQLRPAGAYRLYERLGAVADLTRLGDEQREWTTDAVFEILEDGLEDLTKPASGDAVAWTLVKAVAEQSDSAAERFAEVLEPGLEFSLRPTGQMHVAMSTSRLHAIPWELAAPIVRMTRGLPPEYALVRLVQSALNVAYDARLATDGVLGRVTAGSIRMFQEAWRFEADGRPSVELLYHLWRSLPPDLERPIALVVGPAYASADTESFSGYKRDYAAHGFLVVDAQVRTLAELDQVGRRIGARRAPVAVIHICAPLVDAGGAAALDVTGARTARALGADAEEAEALTSAGLDEFLARALPRGDPALLVLDATRTKGALEVALQLCLRNLLAGQVLEAGRVDAIVAMGLMRESARARAGEILADAAARAVPVGAAVAALADALKAAAGFPDGRLAIDGVALFAQDPIMPAPFAPGI